MVDSCDATNKACNIIVSILNADENNNNNSTSIEEKSLPDAARILLSAITRILILADRTAIVKLVKSATKVGIDVNLKLFNLKLWLVFHLHEAIIIHISFAADFLLFLILFL